MSKDFEVSVIFFCAKNGQRFMMKGKYIHCKHSWLLLAKATLLWSMLMSGILHIFQWESEASLPSLFPSYIQYTPGNKLGAVKTF